MNLDVVSWVSLCSYVSHACGHVHALRNVCAWVCSHVTCCNQAHHSVFSRKMPFLAWEIRKHGKSEKGEWFRVRLISEGNACLTSRATLKIQQQQTRQWNGHLKSSTKSMFVRSVASGKLVSPLLHMTNTLEFSPEDLPSIWSRHWASRLWSSFPSSSLMLSNQADFCSSPQVGFDGRTGGFPQKQQNASAIPATPKARRRESGV